MPHPFFDAPNYFFFSALARKRKDRADTFGGGQMGVRAEAIFDIVEVLIFRLCVFLDEIGNLMCRIPFSTLLTILFARKRKTGPARPGGQTEAISAP